MCFLFLFILFYFCLFRATPMAYGGSQARGLIRARATGCVYIEYILPLSSGSVSVEKSADNLMGVPL